MEKLDDIRVKIDAIDDKLVKLYNERMELVRGVAEAKKVESKPVMDASREEAIISRVTKVADLDKRVYVKRLFNTVFDTSRAYQSRFLTAEGGVAAEIKNALKSERQFPEYATVACQGIKGAYSAIAAEKLFELSDITYVHDFEGVFGAVEGGLCDFGVLPIENSSVGSVNAVYDLMKKHKFYIVKSVKLEVRHCLLAAFGTQIEDIKEIYSQEQAINQCSELISGIKGVKINVVANTAVAAAMVAKSGRNDVAAISSKRCSEMYGLNVLKSNVQDNDNNYTRFICISKKMEIFSNANKISLMVYLPHAAESLNKLLSKFTALGLNLTKLESRPLAHSDFEFLFYFDFDADPKCGDVLTLLSELDYCTEGFTFLGAYSLI